MDKKIIKTLDLNGTKISFEMGEIAPRANASVLASMGETVVLATVTVSTEDTDKDYFPLNVEYIEKFYAGGIISGSRFIKRERYPSDDAILTARMIDRSIRPLFPEELRKDVQVVITVLSYDDKNDPGMLGINATSLAVMLSGLPFEGPIASVRVGAKDGKLILNPTNWELAESDMDFVISGKGQYVTMIDAYSKEVSEDSAAEALDLAVENFSKLIEFQNQIIKEMKIDRLEFKKQELSGELVSKINEKYNEQFDDVIYELKGNIPGERRWVELEKIIDEFTKENEGTYPKIEVKNAVDKILKARVREGILTKNQRPSGRNFDQIRELKFKTGILPRTHGSAFFSRGITQALSIVTLGSTRLEQTLESFEGEETKRFMHHYNGPSYSVGEAGRYSYYPGRREIGHGALAEKGLQPVMPSEEEFPYTIRVVSEILSQQGSSSMAAATAASLALMDAGVPIKSPVAGIAIGLVTSEDAKKHILLTDVQDLEDFYGDMDFKVVGTSKGITAIQMDNKLQGINVSILKEALPVARKAIDKLLAESAKELASPRKNLSKYAPKITTVKISPSKIGDLIGPGGKTIRGIIEATESEIDIQEDGSVHIAAVSDESREKAIKMVKDLVEEAEVGKEYEGIVDKVVPYGAFVDVSPAISGLVHISELAEGFVSDPNKYVKEGQKVHVKVIGIDDEGKVSLSIKRANSTEKEKAPLQKGAKKPEFRK